MIYLKPHRLYHGECIRVMDRCIPDESIDMVCVDPPYGTTNIKWDSVLDFDDLWDQYERIVKPGGVIAIFGNMPFTAHVVLSNERWYKQTLVWDKNKCGSPGLAKIRPMQVHEDIVIFAKPGRRYTYNPQMTEGEPYSRDPAKRVRCNHHGYGFKGHKGIVNTGTRYPTSIIRISRDFSAQQQVHPTQKPVPLMEWLINTYSNPGDRILDNCMGSGSTGVACVNTGRKFVGIEKPPPKKSMPDYFPVAVDRIEKALNSKTVKSNKRSLFKGM